MKNTRFLAFMLAGVLALSLLLTVSTSTLAQQTTPPAPSVTEEADDGGDAGLWGLVGLLGLAGLAGRRRHAPERTYAETSTRR